MNEKTDAVNEETERPLFLKSVVTPVDARVEMGLGKMCSNSFYGN